MEEELLRGEKRIKRAITEHEAKTKTSGKDAKQIERGGKQRT